MTVSIAVARAAAPTSPGTMDLSSPGMGTPKAAMFWLSRGVTDGTLANQAYYTMGWTDGTRDRCIYTAANNAVGTTATNRGVVTTAVLQLRSGAGTIQAEAAFSAWITDGVRINFTNADSVAGLLTVLLIGGTEPQVYAGNFSTNATIGNTTAVTGPGFTPHTIFLASAREATASAAGASFAFGCADRVSGVITQRSTCYASQDGFETANVGAYFSSQYACATCDEGTARVAADITSFDANGFTATTRTQAVAIPFIFLAVTWGTRRHEVATTNPPLSAQSVTYTWPGWRPQLLMQSILHVDTANAMKTDGQAGSYGCSVATAAAQYCTSLTDEEGVETTNTKTVSDDKLVNLPSHTGAAGGGQQATLTGFTSDGYTADFTSVFSTTRHQWRFAVEAETPPGPGIPVVRYHRRRMEVG